MNDAPRQTSAGEGRRTILVVGGIVAALLFGIGLAVVFASVIDRDGVAEAPSEVASASVSPSAAASVEPTSSPAPVATPSPSAAPSPSGDPEVAELVFTITQHSDIVSPLTISLAEDGRLVTTRMGIPDDELPLELKRLTPEGIGLVRDEIMATGLFAQSGTYPPVPRPGHELPGRGGRGYSMEVGTDGGLVEVSWTTVEADEVDWAEPSPERERLGVLGERLITLDSWLPVEAWADPVAQPYVPARYRLFVTSQEWGGEPDDLPPDVETVAWPLDGTLLTYGEERSEPAAADVVRCAVVDDDQAAQLRDAFASAGAPFEGDPGTRLGVATQLGHDAEVRIISIVLIALHPHEADCTEAWPPAFY